MLLRTLIANKYSTSHNHFHLVAKFQMPAWYQRFQNRVYTRANWRDVRAKNSNLQHISSITILEMLGMQYSIRREHLKNITEVK